VPASASAIKSQARFGLIEQRGDQVCVRLEQFRFGQTHGRGETPEDLLIGQRLAE
jgi:hypothetical protein